MAPRLGRVTGDLVCGGLGRLLGKNKMDLLSPQLWLVFGIAIVVGLSFYIITRQAVRDGMHDYDRDKNEHQ